ncbi:SusC/RagA family TonB-linked outer membrane protein [Algibacter miyuki]|uniref:SusC/RagA family TonB-linked outer membrane protein n=1 Tax=Algibacter miyuki TaxID=1306933 RepID=A0ABV5GZK6_9FLAO|nr:TonB-dependent receptor [Algibacter miyuki]MDN3666741.1 TonB-dependent receptor [Algibacter miyuki]
MNKIYSLIHLYRPSNYKGIKVIKSIVICTSFILSGYANSSASFNSTNSFVEKDKTPLLDELQSQISGNVIDQKGTPLAGVNILVKGTNVGVLTDFDGEYNIKAAKGSVLQFSYVGFKTQTVAVGTGSVINITMEEDLESLGEVVVVGYGQQTKVSLVGSITQVKPSELKIPSSNLTTALAGRVAGVIAFQSSGEPGANNADFFIRGATTFGIRQSPLILIDGVELTTNDLARLNTDDIESFSVFKDATATAIYGARGANGVIAVTTKTGEIGKVKVSVRYESTYSQATQNIDLADPITYLQLHGEAVRTRYDPTATPPYALNKIDKTLAGNGNPYVYPVTDWQNELLEDFTNNQRLNFSVSGGGKVARYFVAAGISKDNGILKVDKQSNFNNNIDLKQYYVRSNINIDLTETTEAIIRFNSTVDDYTGPIPTGSQVYNMINRTNPVRFPAYYAPDEANEFTEHLLFGNQDDGNGSANYLNPYAELVKGYRDYSRSLNVLQVEVKQDLAGILPGLSWRGLANMNRTSSYGINRAYDPYYYGMGLYNPVDDTYTLTPLNEGTETLNFNETDASRTVKSVMYLETALNYAQTFKEKHAVSGLLVGIMREEVDGNATELQLSLPSRNIGVSGRFTYGFDKRYFTEFNFGYNGSERFSESNRFGFFPSVGAGWVISNEKFWKYDFINRFKLRGSYGIVGNDAIGSAGDRFFYLSNVNLRDGGKSVNFGTDGGFSSQGVSISRYANPDVTWEKAYKQNYGFEMNFLNDAIQFQAEYFKENRTDILQSRAYIPNLLGLQSDIKANIGEAKSHGFELTLDVNHQFNKDFWIQFTGNYVDTKSEFVNYEEPDYLASGVPWRSREGQSINQGYGLIAERLFVDAADVANSPNQEFGEVIAGDIKYKDINGDGAITELDIVPIGESTQPEISYGFGFSVGYKGFDVSAFFQGLDRFSFYIDSEKLTPFADTDSSSDYLSGKTAENQILQAFADSHWSEDNQNSYALWPRLSTTAIENNNQRSTWWMRDGAFMRLKSLEIGYNFEPKKGGPFGMAAVRMYISGNNLVHWSQFKLWDPELRGSGLNYPLQRVVNIGLKVNL